MNILKNSLKAIALLLVISFASCEDEFDTVGSNIIGSGDFITEPYDIAAITAYSKKIEAVQTNDLPQYLLGAYKDPVYGLSEASLLSQLSLSATDPDFGTNPVLDSVVLVMPYYSTAKSQEDGETVYELDSVYGNGPIKVSVYESNYFLRDLDPETNFDEKQAYYSNQQTEFENNLGVLLTEKNVLPANGNLTLIQQEYANGKIEKDTLVVSPRVRIKLPIEFFQEKIIDNEGSQNLLSNANFQSYLRGLYLKAEAIDGEGSMAAFNLLSENAKVVLYYKHTIVNDGESIDAPAKFDLNFGGNSVTVFNNNFQVTLPEQDTVNGEANLYLKGGEGFMTVVELFSGPDSDGDGVSDELEELREKDWLINEANLTFVVNETMVSAGQKEPERIYVYNLKNNKVLADYGLDFSKNEANPLISRTVHLGRLAEDEDGNRYYKIRLTGHIRNIISQDSANVKLGIAVSSNVNLTENKKLKNGEGETVSVLPTSSIISPEGTILYGNTASDEMKRLKLNIFYTEPK